MESPDEALKRSRDLVKLLTKVGFKLTNFISNVPSLLEQLEDQSVEAVPKVIGASMEESSSHVLGLKWDHNKDTLVVSCGIFCDSSKAVKQRLVFSLVAKVFAPIGLVAPFTVTTLLLLKDVWHSHGQSWDEKLPNEIIDRFSSWSSKLPTLDLLTITRCYFLVLLNTSNCTYSEIVRRKFLAQLRSCVHSSVHQLNVNAPNLHSWLEKHVSPQWRHSPCRSLNYRQLISQPDWEKKYAKHLPYLFKTSLCTQIALLSSNGWTHWISNQYLWQTASRRFLKGQWSINGIKFHLISIQPPQVPEKCLLKRCKKQLVAWSPVSPNVWFPVLVEYWCGQKCQIEDSINWSILFREYFNFDNRSFQKRLLHPAP